MRRRRDILINEDLTYCHRSVSVEKDTIWTACAFFSDEKTQLMNRH